ncbi:MFS transporter [Actinoplanes couchii]|uniref:Major facilitator superfamily MFS_1 n=1 Tax=Actinoplanes couchii TaxID=403638 RepID=A0ABQ3XNH8_9ACTN|nr:MFS transporter [Actinoplanes couchii]MDR6318032.1 hypothetical protein [Actinoplanes couchii]GID60051.1 hypothetical protein Aco03nite_084550 [Actinoplanes couchii]
MSVAEVIYLAAVETMTVDVAPAHWSRRRLSLLGQSHRHLDRIISPVFAGGLIDIGRPLAVVGAALLLLLPALVATLRSGAAADAPRPTRTAASGLSARETWRFITDRADLRYLLAFGAWSNLAVSPVLAMLPLWYAELLEPGPITAVWSSRALAAYAVGMLAGGAVIAARRTEPSDRRALLQATAAHLLICATLAGAAVLASPWLPVVALLVSGALFAVLVAAGGQAWLNAAPPASRARILSMKRLIAFSTIPLGTALMPPVGEWLGYRPATALLAALSAILTLLSLTLWSRSADRKPHPALTDSPAS